MRELHAVVRRVLSFHPRTVTNYATTSESSTEAVTGMMEAAENLVAHLVRVLSCGLHEGLELWTVLETLERVPKKISMEDESSRAKQALHRLKFSGQIVYLIKSTFIRSTAALRTRSLLRLALNQGVLLALLELIARWNLAELKTFYSDSSVSVLCSVDEALWDAFLVACAPIGGVTLTDIEAGVPKGMSVVKFDLKLVLPGVDMGMEVRDDSVKNHGEPGQCSPSRSINHEGEDGSDFSKPGECLSTDATRPPGLAILEDRSSSVHVHVMPVGVRPVRGQRDARRRKAKKKREAAMETATRTIEAAEGVSRAEEEESGGEVVGELGAPPLGGHGPMEEGAPSSGGQNDRASGCIQTLEPLDVGRLLDQAEAILSARWKRLALDMAAQEALLFEQLDSG